MKEQRIDHDLFTFMLTLRLAVHLSYQAERRDAVRDYICAKGHLMLICLHDLSFVHVSVDVHFDLTQVISTVSSENCAVLVSTKGDRIVFDLSLRLPRTDDRPANVGAVLEARCNQMSSIYQNWRLSSRRG